MVTMKGGWEMKKDEMVRIIKGILEEEKKPILLVEYRYYEKSSKSDLMYYCSIFSSINETDEILWFQNDKGSFDKAGTIRMPIEIDFDKIISIKHLSIQDLIDNTNTLVNVSLKMAHLF